MTERQTINDLLATARSRLDRLEPIQARAEVLDGALLIDIRCEEMRQSDGVVPGAFHVPL